MSSSPVFPIRRFFNLAAAIAHVKASMPGLDSTDINVQAERLYSKHTKKHLRKVKQFSTEHPDEYAVIFNKFIKPVRSSKKKTHKNLTSQVEKLKRESKQILRLCKRQYKRYKALLLQLQG